MDKSSNNNNNNSHHHHDCSQEQMHHHHHNNFFILDGGTGREIEARGGPFRQPEWSALALYQNPQLVQEVHESFIKAGAHGVTTNSYAIVPFHLGQQRYDKDHENLLPLSVTLANQASTNHKNHLNKEDTTSMENGINCSSTTTTTKPFVLGSIPPLCGSYEPDKFDPVVAKPILHDFLQAYLVPADCINNGRTTHNDNKVDVLLLETVGSIAEATFYLEEIVAFCNQQQDLSNTPPPVWLSFCIHTEYGYHQHPKLLTTHTTETLTMAMQKLSCKNLLKRANVQVVMVNCCDVRIVTEAIQELRQACTASSLKIGCYPNAFSIPPPDAANHTLRQVDYNITPQVFRDYAQEWIIEGATVIGGCCGIGPAHIEALQSLVVKPVEDDS